MVIRTDPCGAMKQNGLLKLGNSCPLAFIGVLCANSLNIGYYCDHSIQMDVVVGLVLIPEDWGHYG